MQLTQILTSLGALALIFGLNAPAAAQNKSDEVILEMHQAFKKNDKARLTRMLPQAKGHTLEAWAAYWELRIRLDQASSAEIQAFFTQYAGSYAEDRLRNDWLLQLGKQREWSAFASEYPRFRMNDDREVRCYALAAEGLTQTSDPGAELKRLWYAQKETDDGCTTVPDKPTPISAQEKAAANANPGLQRALSALALGLRAEGNREWNYSSNLHTTGGMNERELLAAADLACQRQVWDRCINTSERTKVAIDFDQRFPTPLKDTVLRRAQEIQLDPAYVYGLIRQESRFIMDAKSIVGAAGLMQVMPATARWTAKKIGLKNFQLIQLNEHETNVAIGTGYLKLVLDEFGGSMPLAAAAYNAGPGRSRAWRNGPVLEAAIWAENVPFSETRDYVKKVLSNTTNYAALLTGQPQSLKARLGNVGPRSSSAAEETQDLP